MPSRKKVIKGLECCLGKGQKRGMCEDCPYDSNTGRMKCNLGDMHVDALALLKSQEPMEPILQSGGNYVCGNCGMYTVGFMHPLTGESVQTWKYCGSCGKKVRWE